MKLFEPLQRELQQTLRDATRIRQDLDKARGEVAEREQALARATEAARQAKAAHEEALARTEKEARQAKDAHEQALARAAEEARQAKDAHKQALGEARAETDRLRNALAREQEKLREAEARAAEAAQMDEKFAELQEALAQSTASARGGLDEKLTAILERRGPSRTVVSGPRVDVSGFGGMWLVQAFFRRIRLRDLLVEHVRVDPDPVDYSASETILALLYAVIAGLRRIDRSELMHQNGAFLDLLEVDRFPDAPAIRRFLNRLNAPDVDALAALHDSLRVYLGSLPQKRRELVLDVDAVISAVSGRSKSGKPVGRAYHPLYCYEQAAGEFWNGVLRPGKAPATAGIEPFLQDCLAKIPAGMPRTRVRFRLDGQFYDRRVVDLLDRSRCGFVIPARDNPALRDRASKLRFKRLASGWNGGEYKGKVEGGAARASRFVVLRRPAGEGVHLEIPPLFRKDKYAYYVFVTNLKSTPWAVYEFYRGRLALEKGAREFVGTYPLGQVPPGRWLSNDAFFRILLLAADLLNWFRRTCLPKEYAGESLSRVRSDYLLMPAQLIQQGGQNLFFLPRDLHAREEFLRATRAIAQLKLPPRFVLVRKPAPPARGAKGAKRAAAKPGAKPARKGAAKRGRR